MDNFIVEQIQEQASLQKKEEPSGPKSWTDCTYDERYNYIEKLRGLYKQFGLNEAEITINKQVGLNLAKGGKVNSEEEFMFSENLFSIKQEDNLEKFQNAFRMESKRLAEKYDESTAVVVNECGFKVGD